jgi:hypothetical protein
MKRRIFGFWTILSQLCHVYVDVRAEAWWSAERWGLDDQSLSGNQSKQVLTCDVDNSLFHRILESFQE